MIAGLLVLQALALGLVGEAPCSDVPPSAWSVESTALSLSRHDPCVDLLVASDGALIVAARDRDGLGLEVLSGGAWSTAFEIPAEGCPVLAEADGVVRVAFEEADGVRVATRAGADWPSELVPGIVAPFALLPDGRLRSVEVGPVGATLVVRESGASDDEVVPLPDTPIGGNVVNVVALAVGPAGSTHVLFQRNARATLEYATNASGAWSFEVADSLQFGRATPYGWTYDRPSTLAFVIDGTAHAHVAYRLSPSMKLAYATNASGAWRREIVDHGAPVSLEAALRLAPDGTPWLAWQRVAAGDLVLSTRTDGIWMTVTVDALDTAGTARALALGPDGRWHLAYTRFRLHGFSTYDEPRPLQHAVSVPCPAGRLP